MSRKNKFPDFNALVSDVLDYNSQLLAPASIEKIKSKLAPYFVMIENDLLTAFGKTIITNEEILSEDFRSRYKYISSHFKVWEIKELLRLLRVCRNVMCHSLVNMRDDSEKYVMRFPQILDELCFFDETVCQIDGHLTIQGMLSLMVAFMSNEEMNEFMDTLTGINEISAGKYFFKKDTNLGSSSNDNYLRIKNQLKKRFKNLNNLSFDKTSRSSINFFEYRFIAMRIGEAILSVERYFYKENKVQPQNNYSSFNEAFGDLVNDKTKACWRIARNSWAHGDFLGVRHESNKPLVTLFIDALECLKESFANNRKHAFFVKKTVQQFVDFLFTFEYGRLVELALKLSLPNDYEPKKRIHSMSVVKANNAFISIEDEKRLLNLSQKKQITFDYRYKITVAPEIDVQSIELFSFSLPRGAYASVNGERIDLPLFSVCKVSNCAIPAVQIFDADGKQLVWHQTGFEDRGFFKTAFCEVCGSAAGVHQPLVASYC